MNLLSVNFGARPIALSTLVSRDSSTQIILLSLFKKPKSEVQDRANYAELKAILLYNQT